MNTLEGILTTLNNIEKRLKRLEAAEHMHRTLRMGSSSELTIAGGVITRTQSNHRIDTEGDAASDDLDAINGGESGDLLFLRAENGARTVVVKDATDNLYLEGDMSLDSIYDYILLLNVGGSSWYEISRSNNGA
jgi:hypothetical protein